METRTTTSLKLKTKSGMNMDFTITKGCTHKDLIANILLIAPSESLTVKAWRQCYLLSNAKSLLITLRQSRLACFISENGG